MDLIGVVGAGRERLNENGEGGEGLLDDGGEDEDSGAIGKRGNSVANDSREGGGREGVGGSESDNEVREKIAELWR